MATYYVAPNGIGNASSWANAGDLANTLALILASPSPGGDEIWALGDNNVWGVSGIYSITNTLNMNVPDVRLYGGFRGTETNLQQRNAYIACNVPAFPNYFPFPSVLRGITGLNQSIINVAADDCVIDGFLIENGGGSAVMMGGGLYAGRGLSNLLFENLVFKNNYADDGGGMFLGDCDGVIKNSFFFQNDASMGGGLHLNDCFHADKIRLFNVLFADNGATTVEGGAIFIDHSMVEIINCTFADNHASSINNSNGIFLDGGSPTDIYNSIFYQDWIHPVIGAGVVPNINFCLLNQPFGGGIGNMFSPPPPPFVGGGNYHLQTAVSLCINAGSNAFVPPPVATATDLEGRPRILNGVVDMGAFEHLI